MFITPPTSLMKEAALDKVIKVPAFAWMVPKLRNTTPADTSCLGMNPVGSTMFAVGASTNVPAGPELVIAPWYQLQDVVTVTTVEAPVTRRELAELRSSVSIV